MSDLDPADNSARWPDRSRFGKKYQILLPAFEKIAQDLKRADRVSVGKADIEQMLRDILPYLRDAYNSGIAFFAGADLKIECVDPVGTSLISQTLVLAPEMQADLQARATLVMDASFGAYPQLTALSLDSLLLARFVAPWHDYYVAVANTQDEEGYLSEDAKLLWTLVEMFGSSLRFGEAAARAQNDYERYLLALHRGEYRFLSHGSEDLAAALVPATEVDSSLLLGNADAVLNNLTKRLYPQSRLRISLDDVIADYLDSELSMAMSLPELATGRQASSDPIGTAAELLDDILGPGKLAYQRWTPVVYFHDNHGAHTPLLDLAQFPRTGLAIARVCMWSGFVEAGFRVPDHRSPKQVGRKSLPQKLSNVEPFDLFHSLGTNLVQELAPASTAKLAPISWQQRLDYLRTAWQRVHYLAAHGMLEPSHPWLEGVATIYSQLTELTIEVLQEYLLAEYESATSRNGSSPVAPDPEGRTDSYAEQSRLRIDSDWLIGWLASNALLSDRLSQYHGLDSAVPGRGKSSPAEAMRYLACLSEIILYAIHCARHWWRKQELPTESRHKGAFRRPAFADVPAYMSPSLTEAQLFVLCEYAYHEIGVHRELSLFERLVRQLRYELSLYASGGYYRDHLYHVIDVCLLGELLLRSTLSPCLSEAHTETLAGMLNGLIQSESANSAMPEENLITPGPQGILQDWYVAALCHDLGYLVEKTGALLKPVAQVAGPGLHQFHASMQRGLASGRDRISAVVASELTNSPHPHPSQEDLKKVPATDHGIVAWLHLHDWLAQINSQPGFLAHALTAILRHNLPAQEVNVCREPLTLLLILCDHLQEWGRPRVPADPLARGLMEALRFSEQPQFGERVRSHQLFVEGIQACLVPGNSATSDASQDTGNRRLLQTSLDDQLQFEIQYVEAQEGDFEPALTWLWLCRDLQCFGSHRTQFPLHIKIKLTHTPPRIWRMLPWRPLEMDLLQEFASRCERAAYLLAWIRAARENNKGIQYVGDDRTGVETFTIDLRDLDQPLRRGLNDEHWDAFLPWKWQMLGQRFAKLNLGHWFPDVE